MNTQGIDQIGPAESTSGMSARDIMWAFGLSAVALGLMPVMVVYLLLIA